MAGQRFERISLLLLGVFCVASFASKSVDDCLLMNGFTITIKVHGDSCFYFFMEYLKSFQDAMFLCKSQGGSLAMPKSKDVSDFMKKEIESYTTDNTGTWVGLLKGNTRNVPAFIWLDGETAETTYARTILKYADASTIVRQNGVWAFNKADDKDPKKHFVCEVKGDNSENEKPRLVTTTPTPSYTTTTTTTTNNNNNNINKSKTSSGETPGLEKEFCPIINAGQNYNMRFFGDSCFYFQTEWLSFYNGSKQFCEIYRGTLAMVKTPIIQTFLQYTLKYDLKIPDYSFWIGLGLDSDKNQYVWADGSQVTYTNFRYAFPANDRFAMSGFDDKWVSYNKDTTKNCICQFKSRVKRSPLE